MTVLSRGARVRRGGRRPGWLLLTVLLVLAIGASSALVFTNRVELLKLAVILALWAAVAGAFVSVIYRRQSDIDQAKVRDLKLVYDLQLDREISARREYELTRGVAAAARAGLRAARPGRRRGGRPARRTGRAADQSGDSVRRRPGAPPCARRRPSRAAPDALQRWDATARPRDPGGSSSDRIDTGAAGRPRPHRRKPDHRRARGTAGPPPAAAAAGRSGAHQQAVRDARYARRPRVRRRAATPGRPRAACSSPSPPAATSAPRHVHASTAAAAGAATAPASGQRRSRNCSPRRTGRPGLAAGAAEGQYCHPGAPGSNWAAPMPVPRLGRWRRQPARHSGVDEVPGAGLPVEPVPPPPYGESGRRARSRHSAEYRDYGGPHFALRRRAAAGPPQPAPPTPAAATSPLPAPAPPMHRARPPARRRRRLAPPPTPEPRPGTAGPAASRPRWRGHEAPRTGGQSVADLLARLQAQPARGRPPPPPR